MQYTINLMREIRELFCAPATSIDLGLYAHCDFSVGFDSGGLQPISYPQATATVLINGFYPEDAPLISAKTQIICM